MLLSASHCSAALWTIASILISGAASHGEAQAQAHAEAKFDTEAQSHGGRPAVALLEATVANWDGDGEPDGWIAEVRVLDELGRPVPFFGSATFELVPRVPSADHTRFVAVPGKRLRWTTTVGTDGDCRAVVRLPLRRRLPRTAVGHIPYSGVMRVRVGVPTAGVYEAETGVAINPPGLVDTLWKAR